MMNLEVVRVSCISAGIARRNDKEPSGQWPVARREAKRLLFSVMRSSGAFQLSALTTRRSIPMLCYHGCWMVDDGFPGDAMFIRPETFRQRLRLIRDLSLRLIPLEEAVAMLDGRADGANDALVITIDDG